MKALHKARAAQVMFFGAGVVMLASIWLGSPLALTLFALVVCAAAAGFAQLGLKCRSCGVSYFFDPAVRGWNITGMNMLKRVQACCPKCGAAR